MAFFQKTICCGLILFNSAIGMDTQTASAWILPPELLHKILYLSLEGTWLNKLTTGLRLRLLNRSTPDAFTVDKVLEFINPKFPDELTILLIHNFMSIPVSIGKLLIAQGANINAPQNDDANTLVHEAAIHGRSEQLTRLIALGADIDKPNKHNQKPITCVARSQTQIRTILISHTKQVPHQNSSPGNSPRWQDILS